MLKINAQLERLLEFTVEVEKLKNIQRKTKPVGLERYENSAEHSWHVCLMALMFKEFAEDDINIDRVIKMLLIHDLGEIDTGDIIIYQSESLENKQKEEQGVKRLLSFLSEEQAAEYLSLWQEFEAGESVDSKYARAIDRVPPLLHNLHGDLHSWREHKIKKEQVLQLNSRIAHGSEALWSILKERLEMAFKSMEGDPL